MKRHTLTYTPPGHGGAPEYCEACQFPYAIWREREAGDVAHLLALLIMELRGTAPDGTWDGDEPDDRCHCGHPECGAC